MKQRIRLKVFRNRWRLNYTLGQIFEAAREVIFWMRPGNGYKYFLHYHDGNVYKAVDDGVINRPCCFRVCNRRSRSIRKRRNKKQQKRNNDRY